MKALPSSDLAWLLRHQWRMIGHISRARRALHQYPQILMDKNKAPNSPHSK
jgi:hypothetical protein